MTDGGKIFVSESILHDGTFGVYLVPEDNPSIEYLLVGSLSSVEEAKAKASEPVASFRMGGTAVSESVEVQTRPKPEVAIDVQFMTEDDLKEALRSHIDSSLSGLSKSQFLKAVLSYGNLIFLTCCVAVWIFWTRASFTVPKVDLPIVGTRLGGVSVDADLLARYLPLVLLVLFAGSFLRVVRTNLTYDLLQKHVLALVFRHGWRALDFAKLVRNHLTKRGLGWLVNALDWLHDLDPASLANLRKLTNLADANALPLQIPQLPPTQEGSPSAAVRDELDRQLVTWLRSDFERRIHCLYFLDKEKDYSRFAICFDPLTYLVSLNRVAFRVYSFLVAHGVRVDALNPPTDPYLIQRVATPVFYFGVLFHICFIGGLLVWSLFSARDLPPIVLMANVVAAVLILVIPNWWNYLAVIRKRGFPSIEPLGAYTVGPMTSNRLSLVGL